MSWFYRFAIIALLALFLWLPLNHAQEAVPTESTAEEEETEAERPKDPLGRDTPRGSIEGFLRAVDDDDFVKAVEFLDLRNLPRRYRSFDPTRLAEMLAVVIEREVWIELEELSDDPGGEVGDGLPDYRDELGSITDGETTYALFLQKIPGDEGLSIWKVSNATVAEVADLYEQFGYGPLVEAFANAIPAGSVLGIEYFKLVMAITSALIAYPLFALVGLGLARLFSHPSSALYPRVKRFFIGPAAALGAALVLYWVMRELGVGIAGQKWIRAHTINTIVTVWLLLSGTGLLRDAWANRLHEQGRDAAVVLLRPAAQSIRIIIVLLAALVWLDNMGFDITALLAGLGVGGIAVALALQRPMEDIFGAVSLYTMQPLRVGDLCRIGNDLGEVEEIGLRTTRIRSLADTVISIPNTRLVTEAIDNYSLREKFLYNPTLRLRVDTSPDQLDRILQDVRDLFSSHEKVYRGEPRIRFQNFGKDALELVVFTYTDTRTYADYLEVAEDLNMKILGIVTAAGTSLALPAQTLHMEPQPDQEAIAPGPDDAPAVT
jgi:MscS family membrane protein